jgi:hypothetical protein
MARKRPVQPPEATAFGKLQVIQPINTSIRGRVAYEHGTPPFPPSFRDEAEGIKDIENQEYGEFGPCQTKTSKDLLLLSAAERL